MAKQKINPLANNGRGDWDLVNDPGISGVAWGDITGTLSNQTDLQTALDAKVPTSRTLTAGTGLDGGGDLTANRSFALDSASIASLALADSALQNISGEDHGTLDGLGDDDHTQYALLAGRDGNTLALPHAGIAATPTNALTFINSTAATSGAQNQYSPSQYWEGSTWVGGLTNAARTIRTRSELQSVPGSSAGATYGAYRWFASVDTGTASWSQIAEMRSDGRFNVPSLLVDNTISVNSAKWLLNPAVANNASSVYMIWDTVETITASGFRWLSLRSNGTERMAIRWAPGNAVMFDTNNGRLDFDSGFNAIYFRGASTFFESNASYTRVGDSSSVATQRDSRRLSFQNAVWTGSNQFRFSSIISRASTATAEATFMDFVLAATNDSGSGGTIAMSLKWSGTAVLGADFRGDIETITNGSGFILQSPDATRWRITVDNAGVLSAAAV